MNPLSEHPVFKSFSFSSVTTFVFSRQGGVAARDSFRSPSRPAEQMHHNDTPRSSTPIPMDQQAKPIRTNQVHPNRNSTSNDAIPGQSSTTRWANYLVRNQEQDRGIIRHQMGPPIMKGYPQQEEFQRMPERQSPSRQHDSFQSPSHQHDGFQSPSHQHDSFQSPSYYIQRGSDQSGRGHNQPRRENRPILDSPRSSTGNHVGKTIRL